MFIYATRRGGSCRRGGRRRGLKNNVIRNYIYIYIYMYVLNIKKKKLFRQILNI